MTNRHFWQKLYKNTITAELTDEQALDLATLFMPWKAAPHTSQATGYGTAINCTIAYRHTHRSLTGHRMLHPRYGRTSAWTNTPNGCNHWARRTHMHGATKLVMPTSIGHRMWTATFGNREFMDGQ